MTKNQPTTKTKNQPIELSPVLDTIPAHVGIEELRLLNERFGIIPTVALDILSELDRLAGLFERENLTVLDLVKRQASVLQMATGVAASAVTRHHPSAVAEKLHTARNLIVAAAAAAVATIATDSPHTSPAAVYANSIQLARRSHHVRRPFADDEIVLCRVAAHLVARVDPRDHAATTYVLIESGLVPGETTKVCIEDFDEPELPQLVLAPGNAHLKPRFVELDQFTSHTLGRHLEHAHRAGRKTNAPLVYKGRGHEPGSSSAIASAQRKIDRFLEQLGLPTGDITASSITQWRIATVLRTQGSGAAHALSGRTWLEQMYRGLGECGTATKSARPDDDGVTFSFAA
jgi:integrase